MRWGSPSWRTSSGCAASILARCRKTCAIRTSGGTPRPSCATAATTTGGSSTTRRRRRTANSPSMEAARAMRILLIPLVLLGALGCSASQAGKTPAAPPGPVAPKPWAILPQSQGPIAFAQCSRQAPSERGPFWSPSVAQIEELEGGLPAYLGEQGHAKQASQLGSYRRQYVGFERAGRKLVYLNALLAESVESMDRLCNEGSQTRGSPPCAPEVWRREAMFVCDGGDS